MDDQDRRRFLGTLEEAIGKCGWRLHAYVLMTNYYHLIVETPNPNLVRGMTWFQTTYTMRYNARHRSSGHLFGGRYKAIVVDPEEPRYLASLLDYVHLNPVRAGLTRLRGKEGLLGYAWSSLPAYARRKGRPGWLCVERGLGAFGWTDSARERRAFVDRLEVRVRAEGEEPCGTSALDGQSLQSTLWRGWYFGREAFRDWLLEKADGALGERRRGRKNYHGPEVRDHGEAEARRLIAAGLRRANLTNEELRTLPKSDPRKARIARAVRRQTTVPLRWLAEQLVMGNAVNVSRLTAR
jgi:putative transposase